MNKLLLVGFSTLVLLVGGAARGELPAEKEIDGMFERLREALKDPDPGVRRKAVTLLGRIAQYDGVDLRRALHDEDKSVRVLAATSMRVVAGGAQDTVRDLIRALKDPEKEVRLRGAFALGIMSSVAKDAVPVLIEVLKDPTSEIRPRAAWALGGIGPGARAAVPALVNALKVDSNSTDRDPLGSLGFCAGIALSNIGPEARDAIPALLAIVQDSGADVETQAAAFIALSVIGAPDAVLLPLLIDSLKDKKRRALHGGVARILVKYGPRAKAAGPALVNALDLRELKDREFASYIGGCVVEALWKTGADPKLAAPAIAQFFADPTAQYGDRLTAASALKEFGPEAKRGLPEIRGVLLNPKDRLFNHAFVIMGALGPGAVPTLEELVKTRDPDVRKAAQRTLERIQQSSKNTQR